MKLIARQSIKSSILNYIGYAIGTISSIFLYTYDFAFSGEIRFLQATATLFLPFVVFGSHAAVVKFYNVLSEKKQQQKLYFLGVILIVCNTLFITLLYFLAQVLFTKLYFINDIWEHFPYIIVLALSTSMVQLTSKYISNLGRITISTFFENVLPKLAAAIAFVGFFFYSWKKENALWFFVGSSFVAVVGMLIYLSRLEKIKAENPLQILEDSSFKKEYLQFSLFSVLGGMGYILSSQIDLAMIGEMKGDFDTGTYATLLSILGILTIPFYALTAISGPVVSQFIHKKEFLKLQELYQKSSLYIFLIGCVLFSCIIAGSDSLFSLMKNGNYLQDLKPVLYILGFAMLFDMATGFNNQIISYSKHYKYTIFVNLILAFLTIFLNFLFLKFTNLGVIGVAIATCISLFTYNLLKLQFIYKNFQIQPFSIPIFHISILLVIALISAYFIPEPPNKWLSLVYKPTAVLAIFFLGNGVFKILPFQKIKLKNLKNELMGKS